MMLRHSSDCTLRMRCRGEYAEGCELCELNMDYRIATSVPPVERTPHESWAVATWDKMVERERLLHGNPRGGYVRIRD